MSNDVRTISESLFEELCASQGVGFERLPELEGDQQPDYELDLRGQRVVVEVKQIEPNADDRTFAEALERTGKASQCRNPDAVARRVRNHIGESRSQINSYLERHPGTPAILVLFDKARNQYTDPYTIQTAMHGWEHVVFDVASAVSPPAVIERGFGPRNNKEVRPDKNQQMSALATLHECWHFETHERFLALCFYHNPFAAHKFEPTWWQGKHVMHYRLSDKTPGQFQDWAQIGPSHEEGRDE